MDDVVTGIRIGARAIGDGEPCFIIAEAGVNHNGDLELARRLVDAAAAAGADAVKFQTFKASRLVTRTAPKAEYQRTSGPADETQYAMLERLELSPAAHRELMVRCRERGMLFLSTPFEEESADLLADLGVPAFKVSSGDLTNHPFLAHLARKGRPIILSTGMATLAEVEAAVGAIAAAGRPPLVLLHCVSNYPAAFADVNLRAMLTLRSTCDVPVGFSDHTEGLEVACAAVALGACVVEKHLTLDRNSPGPDHRASIEPRELGLLVDAVRHVEAALGHGRKEPAAVEAAIAGVARKSLVAAHDIPAGAVVTEDMIVLKRPGTGLSSEARGQVIGRRASVRIAEGAVIALDMLA